MSTGAPPSASGGYAWERDTHGIVTVTLDDPGGAVNIMNDHYASAMAATVDRLEAERDDITGVIFVSAKKSWFAGGDLHRLRAADPARAAEETARIDDLKGVLRRMERLGRPVVAAMNDTALGGGLEIALAAHHRIATDAPHARFGLPEISLGLLPGGGGTTRLVRMLGLQRALSDVILPATRFSAEQALAVGIIDDVVPAADLDAAARAWILANPTPVKPWDEPGFRLPGGGPTSPDVATMLATMPALLRKQTHGAPMPAPRAAMAAAVEGAYVDFDTASQVETRYLVSLTHTQVAKNMITTFFDRQRINAGASRPQGYPKFTAHTVGIVGAGPVGSAIASAAARAGLDVVLRDPSFEDAIAGRDAVRALAQGAVARDETGPREGADALLSRITPTADLADLAGVDIVVEAASESVSVTRHLLRDLEGIVAPGVVRASATGALPVAELAAGVDRRSDVIGIRVSAPLERIPLVEVVTGGTASNEAIATAFDFVQQIRRTPIVVHDQHGYFTRRALVEFAEEAVAAVSEGVEPASVEQAARQAGYAFGGLALLDELSLTVAQEVRRETEVAASTEGDGVQEHPSHAVIEWMVEDAHRPGRRSRRGFYDYEDSGARVRLWPGLRERFDSGRTVLPLVDLQERLLFRGAIAAVRCLDAGVLTTVPDVNIGSIQAAGFPAWTGGVLQYIDQYDGGPGGFIARCRELADAYGDRFLPPESLVAKAAAGELFADDARAG